MQQEKLDRLQKKEEEETLKEEPPLPPPQPVAEPVLAAEPLTVAAVVAANAPPQDDAPPPVLSPEVGSPVTALCMLCLCCDVVQITCKPVHKLHAIVLGLFCSASWKCYPKGSRGEGFVRIVIPRDH